MSSSIENAWIYLDAAGIEKLAHDVVPYYWDFSIRTEQGIGPSGSTLVAGPIPLKIPDRDSTVTMAVEALKVKLSEARAEAHVVEKDYLERIQKLMAITWEAGDER